MLLFGFYKGHDSSNLSRSFIFPTLFKIFQITYFRRRFIFCVNDFICKSYTVFTITYFARFRFVFSLCSFYQTLVFIGFLYVRGFVVWFSNELNILGILVTVQMNV